MAMAAKCRRLRGSGSRATRVSSKGSGSGRRGIEHYAANIKPRDGDEGERWAQRDRAEARSTGAVRHALADDLALAPSTWSELAVWAHTLVARWIGVEATRARWSPFEQEAARRVDAAIDRLGTLDAVEASPTLEVFRRSLTLELDAARDRVGRLGEGLLVGSAALALGVELDRVWVCGLAEGVFPAPPRDDPLLADADRGALDGELPLKRDRIADDQRALLASLESTTGTRTLCFPRGDLRRNTEHVPSRFLLDTVEALAGVRTLEGPDTEPWYTVVPSFLHGLTHAPFPATLHELDVRAALAGDAWIAAAPAVARGTELARGSPEPGLHSLRRQPLACRRRAHREEPVVARDRDLGNPPRDLGEVPARVLRRATSCTCGRSSGPRSSSSSRHSTRATSCTRRSTRS